MRGSGQTSLDRPNALPPPSERAARHIAPSSLAAMRGMARRPGSTMIRSTVLEPEADHLLTRQEAADRLNVTPRFVTRCVQERRIRYVRVGRMVRIPESAIAEYVQANTVSTRKAT